MLHFILIRKEYFNKQHFISKLQHHVRQVLGAKLSPLLPKSKKKNQYFLSIQPNTVPPSLQKVFKDVNFQSAHKKERSRRPSATLLKIPKNSVFAQG